MIFALPLISQLSALSQSGILGSLLLISYFHKGARYTILGLILAYVGFKIIVPVVSLAYTVFKWIALFGFYGTYFQVGIGFIVSGFWGAFTFVERVVQDMERNRPDAEPEPSSNRQNGGANSSSNSNSTSGSWRRRRR